MTTTVNTPKTLNLAAIHTEPRHGDFDLLKFADMMDHYEDFERKAFVFMADLNSYFYFESLIQAQKDLDQRNLTQFLDKHLISVMSYSSDNARVIADRYLLKAIREIVELNTIYKQITGNVFMRMLKKDEEGMWDREMCRQFFYNFEAQFDAWYNPENLDGENFRDIRWRKRITN